MITITIKVPKEDARQIEDPFDRTILPVGDYVKMLIRGRINRHNSLLGIQFKFEVETDV